VKAFALLLLLTLVGCTTGRPIEPAIPYAVWPVVARLRAEIDKPAPEALRLCADRRAMYSSTSGTPYPAPGFDNEACLQAWRDYEKRRQALEAQFVYFTGPDYVSPSESE